MSEYRKPVAAVYQPLKDPVASLVYVICDDGAVFYTSVEKGRWEEDEPIPGTGRDAGMCKNGDEPR